MKSNFVKTMAAGAIMGVAAGMLLLPELDRDTKRRIKKTGRLVMNRAEDMYDGMKGWVK